MKIEKGDTTKDGWLIIPSWSLYVCWQLSKYGEAVGLIRDTMSSESRHMQKQAYKSILQPFLQEPSNGKGQAKGGLRDLTKLQGSSLGEVAVVFMMEEAFKLG